LIFIKGLGWISLVEFHVACKWIKGIFGPSKPEERPELKTYHIEITYIREEISYQHPYDGIECYISSAGYTSSMPPTEVHLSSRDYFDKLDEYTFKSKTPYAMQNNENSDPHKICFMDLKRYDGIHEGSGIVGTIIILRVVETGFELRLQNIVRCDIRITPYKDDWAKMSIFWLTLDGKLKNYK